MDRVFQLQIERSERGWLIQAGHCVREYLEQLAGKPDPNEDAVEFERLSRLARGDSRGWKFNREELHERS